MKNVLLCTLLAAILVMAVSCSAPVTDEPHSAKSNNIQSAEKQKLKSLQDDLAKITEQINAGASASQATKAPEDDAMYAEIEKKIAAAKAEYEKWIADDTAKAQPSSDKNDADFAEIEKQIEAAKSEYEKWIAEEAAKADTAKK